MTEPTPVTRKRLQLPGSNPCVDVALIFEGPARLYRPQPRQIALIRRGDDSTWALPGGGVNAGELADIAALRELHEGTGVNLTDIPHDLRVLAMYRRVDDPRNEGDERYVTTNLALARVTEQLPLTAGDDAVDARWFPMTTTTDLIKHLRRGGLGDLYQPHPELLDIVVDELQLLDRIITYFDTYIGWDLAKTGVPEEEVLRQRRIYIREIRRNPSALHAITSTAD